MPATTEQVERLRRINAEYRFRTKGPTFDDTIDARTNPTGKMRQIDNGGVFCDIFDATVQLDQKSNPFRSQQPYAIGRGADEFLALEDALAKAENTEKPKTPAQVADEARFGKKIQEANARAEELAAQLAASNAEIESLKAQLAGATQKPGSPVALNATATTPEAFDEKTALQRALTAAGVEFAPELGLARLRKLAAEKNITI